MEYPKRPMCPRCECTSFLISGIVYERADGGPKEDMRVVICKDCGAIIGIPTKPIFDCFEQVGKLLGKIINRTP
jgi:RNase P subunit RPR2